ncbi:O-methyltransferase [Ferruginibacter paludis]|uniref:O-methyltransferase n=1 Tax=Ferruginibacter paludis TaxID=1310417 RepID=UPI0025B4C3E5|nr:O-methyltransferase [Ferruginibacter paludis]MDN3654595.1 O-methyltransferase [Ferruginibacter paludis]
MDIVNIAAEAYASNFSFEEDDLLHEINQYTTATHDNAHMLSGHVQGSFLSLLSTLLQPSRILEIGTFTGYSALCLAKGLRPGGMLHTVELREPDAATAKSYFERSVYKNNIRLHLGDANDIIPTLNEQWDIVFIDADKTGYIGYYDLILPAVKQNGVIIADNTLFHGQVLEENISGKNAKAVHAFNEHVKNDPGVQQVLLTVRDGLMLIRKL